MGMGAKEWANSESASPCSGARKSAQQSERICATERANLRGGASWFARQGALKLLDMRSEQMYRGLSGHERFERMSTRKSFWLGTVRFHFVSFFHHFHAIWNNTVDDPESGIRNKWIHRETCLLSGLSILAMYAHFDTVHRNHLGIKANGKSRSKDKSRRILYHSF